MCPLIRIPTARSIYVHTTQAYNILLSRVSQSSSRFSFNVFDSFDPKANSGDTVGDVTIGIYRYVRYSRLFAYNTCPPVAVLPSAGRFPPVRTQNYPRAGMKTSRKVALSASHVCMYDFEVSWKKCE
jgi:hypothetical protein